MTPWIFGAGSEAPRPFPAVDEAQADSELSELLVLLRKAVIAEDIRPIERMLFPRFRVEFDGGIGPEAFRRTWGDKEKRKQLWQVLTRLLSLGGAFYSPTLFCLPYVYPKFPRDLDPLAHVVVTGENIPLLTRPERLSPAAAVLGNCILPLAKPLEPPVMIPSMGFVEVRHPTHGEAFLSGFDVYSPAGHRMFFEKRQGRWQWISLAAATLAPPPGVPPRN